MASNLRHIAQAPAHSPARAKFFLTIADYTTADPGLFVTVGEGETVSSVMTSTEFGVATDANTTPGIAQYRLLKDMGREIVVCDTNGLHTQKWRQVQIVNGTGSEGVPVTDAGLYVLAWAADGTAANIARTG